MNENKIKKSKKRAQYLDNLEKSTLPGFPVTFVYSHLKPMNPKINIMVMIIIEMIVSI